MIETILNGIGLLIIGGCLAAAAVQAAVHRNRIWMMLALFCIAFFLGEFWWLLFLFLIRRELPNSLIPYIDWYAAWLFLILLLELMEQERPVYRTGKRCRIPWAAPAFTAGMAVFYMQWGSYFTNLVTAVLMGVLMWKSVNGLLVLRGKTGEAAANRPVYRAILVYCLLEYALWMSSCIEYGHPLRSLYDVFSLLVYISLIPLSLAVRRAVDV